VCEALGGAHPFASKHTAEYLAKIGEGRLQWGPRASRIPASLRRVIRTWLHADWRRRPAELSDLLETLAASVRPRRRISAAGGLVALVIAPWLAMSTVQPPASHAAVPVTCTSPVE
jgi:hypothetical protein